MPASISCLLMYSVRSSATTLHILSMLFCNLSRSHCWLSIDVDRMVSLRLSNEIVALMLCNSMFMILQIRVIIRRFL